MCSGQRPGRPHRWPSYDFKPSRQHVRHRSCPNWLIVRPTTSPSRWPAAAEDACNRPYRSGAARQEFLAEAVPERRLAAAGHLATTRRPGGHRRGPVHGTPAVVGVGSTAAGHNQRAGRAVWALLGAFQLGHRNPSPRQTRRFDYSVVPKTGYDQSQILAVARCREPAIDRGPTSCWK
jgi:hypothetical protein